VHAQEPLCALVVSSMLVSRWRDGVLMKISLGVGLFVVGLLILLALIWISEIRTPMSTTMAYHLCSSHQKGHVFDESVRNRRTEGLHVERLTVDTFRIGYGDFYARWLCKVRLDEQGRVAATYRERDG
jgi:hypothetical protein